MKACLVAAALAAAFALAPTGASASLITAPAALPVAALQPDAKVHWRPYWHCHPRRGVCHAGRPWHRRWESRRAWHSRWESRRLWW